MEELYHDGGMHNGRYLPVPGGTKTVTHKRGYPDRKVYVVHHYERHLDKYNVEVMEFVKETEEVMTVPMIQPRNDLVLIRIKTLDTTSTGIAIPQFSMQGKEYIVEAIGPKVEGLKVGDKVLMTGSQENGDYSFLPNHRDLLVIRESNVVLIFNEEAVNATVPNC